ncbi:MAG: four helix bundle protein, partial [Bacteroidota bacterium]
LLRAGTSVGANYRAACRAKSKADFIYKLGICVEEADEACYWMELLIEAQLVREEEILPHKTEPQEILSIISKSRATAKKNLKN